MNKKIKLLLGITFTVIAVSASAKTITVPMYRVAAKGHGSSIGRITLKDTQYGLLITSALEKIKPGIHGFHVHQYPVCSNNGLAAGGHLDPKNTQKHLGPYNPNGHWGDLPALTATKNGVVTLPVLAPRLKVSDVEGHSLMLHVGGDNYSDVPKKLGGGGARFACGVIMQNGS